MGNIYPSNSFLALKKTVTSLLLLSALGCFALPAFAENQLAGKKLAVATPTNKADAITEALRRALLRKKQPSRVLEKEDQSSQEQRREMVKQKLLQKQTAEQPEKAQIKQRRAMKKPKKAMARANQSRANRSSNIFFAGVGGEYFHIKAKNSANTEFKYAGFASQFDLGWTRFLNKRWGVTTKVGAKFYPEAQETTVTNDEVIRALSLDIMASYLLTHASVLSFGVAREDELYTQFVRRNATDRIDIRHEGINKVKLGWSYLVDKYAKGKNGFNLNLEALSSGNKLKSTVRYGASYFFDFVLNRSSLVKLEFGVDYVKKDTKVALDPALAVKDIAETRLSGGLRYYF